MPSSTSSTSFFNNYPSFRSDPTAPLAAEFDRLAISQKWKKGSDTYKKYKLQCVKDEFTSQSAALEARSTSKLETWQALYAELFSRSSTAPNAKAKPLPVPTSITQCKKALAKIHINIIDLIDCRRTGKPVRVFDTQKELQRYTRRTKKFYPREEAKEDGYLKVLLRSIKAG